MTHNLSKGEVVAERASAVAYRGHWISNGQNIIIWEGLRPLPEPVTRNARALVEISQLPGCFPIRLLEPQGEHWTLVSDIPDGVPIESQFWSLKEEASFPFARLADLLIHIAATLEPLHRLELPACVIGRGGLVSESANGTPVRIDLSHAIVPSTTVDWLSASASTVRLLPQEVLRGLPSIASDLYSIGMLAFMALGGQPGFSAERDDALLEAIVTGRFVLRPPALLVGGATNAGQPTRSLADQGTQELWDAISGMLGRSPYERDVDLGTLTRTARQLKSRMEPYAQVARLINRGEYLEAIARADALIGAGLPQQAIVQLRRLQFQAHTKGELRPVAKRESFLKSAIDLCKQNGWSEQESSVRGELALFYLHTKLNTLARKEAELAALASAGDFSATLLYATVLLAVQDVHGGITVLGKLRQKYPFNSEVAFNLVRALLVCAKTPAGALQASQEALVSLPGNRRLLMQYAEVCLQAGNRAEAISVLLELDPQKSNLDVQNALAQAYVTVGDQTHAMEHLLRSLELQGDQQQVLDQLVELMAQGRAVTMEFEHGTS
jgi:tetratricopeptide (TPR) repeat protein